MFGSLATFLKERLQPAVKVNSGCYACGRCCEAFGAYLRASEADIARWRALGRTDILGHVGETGWLWLDPETGERLQQCPFLTRDDEERALCAIHAVKPNICRAYPTEAIGRVCVRGVYFPVSLWADKPSDGNSGADKRECA